MITAQRHLFDIPDGVTYLNAAYMTPQLRAVTEAGRAAVAAKSRPWEVSPEDFFIDSERLRRLFAEIIGADGDGVALVPAVSYGIETAARNMRLSPGDRILVLAEQFPSNVYPWRAAAERSGAEVITVDRPPGDGSWADAVADAVDSRTAVVATANIHWTDGSLIDVVAIGKAARAVDAVFVVDATQSLGSLPFDASVVQPDYVVAGGYKSLLGPYSLGYLWAAPQHRLGLPLENNWIGRAGSENFAGLVDYKDDFQPGARRFDVGERSNFILVPMAIAALRQVLDWGPVNVAEYIGALTDRAEAAATAAGLAPIPKGRRGPNLIGVRVPSGLPPGLSGSLAAAGIYISVRGDSIRIAPHTYNDAGDIDRLFEALASLL